VLSVTARRVLGHVYEVWPRAVPDNLPAVPVRKAVIPAAGLGTRFLPATKAVPKELLPLVDKPAIQWVVEEAVAAGITDILLVSGRSKRAVEDHFDRSPDLERTLEAGGRHDQAEQMRSIAEMANIHVIRQHSPGGLGQAVGLARHHVGDDAFAVLLPDDLMAEGSTLLADMIKAHDEEGTPVLALKRFPPDRISAYGVVTLEGNADEHGVVRVTGMVEKPPADEAPSDLAIMGRYILTPDVFDCIEQTLPGAKGELQLTDAMQLLSTKRPFRGVVFDEGRYDTGDKLDWLRATVEVGLHHPDLGPAFREALVEIVRRENLL
jgi:UTP--glucose-1-phosphate uridylyltransferase